MIANLNDIDLFGVLHFLSGVTQQKIQLKSGATLENTVVVLSCITDTKLNTGTSFGYFIKDNELIVVTSSTYGDRISYLIKYLF